MTTSRLPSSAIQQLTPLLESLARMVAAGSKLSEAELGMLILGVDLEAEPTTLDELKRWGKILMRLQEQRSDELRGATVEALRLRGLPKASASLAVDIVANGASEPQSGAKTVVTEPVDVTKFIANATLKPLANEFLEKYNFPLFSKEQSTPTLPKKTVVKPGQLERARCVRPPPEPSYIWVPGNTA